MLGCSGIGTGGSRPSVAGRSRFIGVLCHAELESMGAVVNGTTCSAQGEIVCLMSCFDQKDHKAIQEQSGKRESFGRSHQVSFRRSKECTYQFVAISPRRKNMVQTSR